MKKTIAVAAIAAVSGLASADTLNVNLSGAQFFEGLGGANETMQVFVGASASITNIAWDVNLTTFTDPNAAFPSWAQEATMDFNGAFGIAVGAGDNFGVVNQNYANNIDVSLVLGADGILTIEFYESFVDSAFADSAFKDDSSITLTFVPAPSAMAMLGLGGIVAGRRRR